MGLLGIDVNDEYAGLLITVRVERRSMFEL